VFLLLISIGTATRYKIILEEFGISPG